MGLEHQNIFDNDYHPKNKYLMTVGVIELRPIKIGEITTTFETVDLPDSTPVASGRSQPIEFEAEFMLHDIDALHFFQLWEAEVRGMVANTAYKEITITRPSNSDSTTVTSQVLGAILNEITLPDVDLSSSDPQVFKVKFKAKKTLNLP